MKASTNFNSDAKLRAFLKKESERLGISIENTYNTYFSRLLLERISKLSYDKLYVKGSFSLYSHLNKLIRPVTDLDIVSTEEHHDPILTLYQAMYDSNDDNIVYELTDLPKKTATGIYQIHLTANFGRIKHPISIDYQELSPTIYEIKKEMVFPIFIGQDPFYINTPSLEEHLAEKLCIVAESTKPDVLNTRVKDFYDIHKLIEKGYNEEKLSLIFASMICDRGKIDESILGTEHLDDSFIKRHIDLWNVMSKKLEFLDKSVDFKESVQETKELLEDNISTVEERKHLIKSITPKRKFT